MINLLKKMGLNEKMAKNFWVILIIATGGSIIYGLPYFRYDYYDAYLVTYNLTDTQMGLFGSVLGIFGMISYLFGGIVADRFSTKTILTVSLIGTGLGGFVHLLPLGFEALMCLYAFWGVSSLFAFWPACIKAVKILAGEGDQGKAFGFFEGGRGVAAALMAMAAVVAFNIGAGEIADEVVGMKCVIVFYSVLTILTGILVFTMMKEEKSEVAVEKTDKISFSGVISVLKMPAIWIIGFTTFCTYVFTLSLYYFTPYSTEILGATVAFGATLAAMKRWFSLFGSVGGGYLTDKIGTGNMLLISFLVMAGGTGAILMLPTNTSSIVMFAVLFIVIYIFYNVNYAMTWAMMEEANIPKEYSATAAGVISTIGYLPEIFCSALAGILIDQNPGVAGYRMFFGFLIAMLLLGAVVVIVWKVYLSRMKKATN